MKDITYRPGDIVMSTGKGMNKRPRLPFDEGALGIVLHAHADVPPPPYPLTVLWGENNSWSTAFDEVTEPIDNLLGEV